MSVYNLTLEENDRRITEGDQSIYLPQPNWKFEPTSYKERIAHVIGLDYQGLQDKISRREIPDKIAIGLIDAKTGSRWYDKDPNRAF